MLPEVKLGNVSREDVDRIAWWLEDKELSTKWFGHYGCGDPIHRGYDPLHVLEASDAEWDRVFRDPHRLIYSIYTPVDEHIGECQLVMDGHGGVELSLLIGRKDNWHHGYGTATVLVMLDKIFDEFRLERAWVDVPEDNAPAFGLFEKLGFVREETRELCKRPDGSSLNASILAIHARSYARRGGKSKDPRTAAVLTIHGLQGSGSGAIGRRVAQLTGRRFVDEEIAERVCQRLRCSPGELQAFESRHRSFWSRWLNAMAVSAEWSGAYDNGYHWVSSDSSSEDRYALEDRITKKQYVEVLGSAIRKFVAEGDVVLHSHASHLFVPGGAKSVDVFVSASPEFRGRRLATEQGLDEAEAATWMKHADRETASVFKNLLGSNLLEMDRYDLVINVDRLSIDDAAHVVAGAVETSDTGAERPVQLQPTAPLS